MRPRVASMDPVWSQPFRPFPSLRCPTVRSKLPAQKLNPAGGAERREPAPALEARRDDR